MKAAKNDKRSISRYVVFAALSAGFFLIATGLIAQPLMAKGRGWYGPGRSADEIVQTLTDRLDLTAEQAEAVRPIIEEKTELIKEIREEKGAFRKQTRSEMHKVMLNTDIQLGRVLNDEQVEKYIELKQEQRELMKRGNLRGGKMRGQFSRTPEQKIERLSTMLDLTGEQALQIEPIIKESMEKRQKVFDTYSGRGQRDRQSMRDEMHAIGDETHEQLSTILTEEQMDELNSIKEERRARMDSRMDRPGRMGF